MTKKGDGLATYEPKKERRETRFGGRRQWRDDGRKRVGTNALLELSSPEIISLWPGHSLEHGLLNLIFKMSLHMITQKANTGEDSQSIASGLSLLLTRVAGALLQKNDSIDPLDLVSPLVELALKNDCTALFLAKLVADIEHEESVSDHSEKLLQALFSAMANAAVNDAPGDNVASKNISLFFTEVAKRCVSAAVKMQDTILPALQSENYDIRKAILTCVTEIIVQKYSGHTSTVDESVRDSYLNELFFRIMDINPFVRNHVLHMWEKLVEIKAVPKRYYTAVTEAVVGRLEDKNYLVRDSALACISVIAQKNWFGQVLNSTLIREKFSESRDECVKIFQDTEKLENALLHQRNQFTPKEDIKGDLDIVDEGLVSEDRSAENTPPSLTDSEITAVNKYIFYENTLKFINLIKVGLGYSIELLESKTERDVIESIKLIVTCAEHHVEGGEDAFLHVLVLVFQGEIKIQLAVRDAFIEVVFNSVSRLSASAATRAMICAQKLISILSKASEGELSAVERIFLLLKSNPAYSRHISSFFLDAVWGIAEGSLDNEASVADRRTAMHIYSILSKFFWERRTLQAVQHSRVYLFRGGEG
ncbi:condensin complex subunit 1 [Angomonas deanei]|uniref:Uncharacterized protein n=1 Tax=Angomonas deanei TaxID=59799 RepID=A0A7G2CUQ4_9TRYP|nr:condensin complex subunit 1 [Angomonas deanei]CAD2222012.1 hypothetical protein, conserved [Angomonas deanei]|eukprot:EPY39471.1 condensin complex subunit 1 [Angomonas deanei]